MSEDRRVPTVKDYLKAGYPALFLRTVEASVSEKEVYDAAVELGLEDSVDFGVWKSSSGLQIASLRSYYDTRPRKAADDLLTALQHVETVSTDDNDSVKPVICVFHNMRMLIDNYMVIQQMCDTIEAARLKGSHIIMVGPHLDVPYELKNLITFVDCPLPSASSIEKSYREFLTAYSDDIELPKDKEEYDSLLRSAATAAVGLDWMGAENAMALSMAVSSKVDIQVIQSQKEQEVRKSDVLEFFPSRDTLDTVGGFKGLKVWLERRKRAFTEEAREYGLPYPKGILLVGIAGSGKSLAAKAVAGFLGLPLLRLDIGKVFRSLVGDSEAAIRLALKVTEAVSPVVLWLDEIEKGLAGMAGSGELDSGVTARVVSTLLTWRQETTAPVMLVATANDINIPATVYRKGRLDEVWATDLPELEERVEIFDIHLKKRGRDPKKFDVALLAKRTDGFTGAEIEGCIEDGMFTAFDNSREVKTADVVRAVGETVPQSVSRPEELQAIREWSSKRARKVSELPPKLNGRSKGSKVRKLH